MKAEGSFIVARRVGQQRTETRLRNALGRMDKEEEVQTNLNGGEECVIMDTHYGRACAAAKWAVVYRRPFIILGM